MALLAALAMESRAADRAYVMNGFWAGPGMAKIAGRLREHGYIVAHGSYTQAAAFPADACAHPVDRIVVIGHSFGADAAARVAPQVAACGAGDVTMISIDAANPSIAVRGVSRVVNFVGEYGITIAGAQNIAVPNVSHMTILESPAVQERILSETIPRRARPRR
jgi:hypothetical protein